MCEQSQACISVIAAIFPMMTRMGQSSGLVGGAAAMRRGPSPTPTSFSHELRFLEDLCHLFLASVVGMPIFFRLALGLFIVFPLKKISYHEILDFLCGESNETDEL